MGITTTRITMAVRITTLAVGITTLAIGITTLVIGITTMRGMLVKPEDPIRTVAVWIIPSTGTTTSTWAIRRCQVRGKSGSESTVKQLAMRESVRMQKIINRSYRHREMGERTDQRAGKHDEVSKKTEGRKRTTAESTDATQRRERLGEYQRDGESHNFNQKNNLKNKNTREHNA
jgi:hypothetical protein